jgi:ankyrin repeat protein
MRMRAQRARARALLHPHPQLTLAQPYGLHASFTFNQDAKRAKADGNTALHWACLNGHAAVVGVLLGAGASVSALNGASRTPYDEAAQAGAEEVLAALSAAGGGPPPGDELDDVEEGEGGGEGEGAEGEGLEGGEEMPLD